MVLPARYIQPSVFIASALADSSFGDSNDPNSSVQSKLPSRVYLLMKASLLPLLIFPSRFLLVDPAIYIKDPYVFIA